MDQRKRTHPRLERERAVERQLDEALLPLPMELPGVDAQRDQPIILVASAERNARQAIERMLRFQSYAVVTAADGRAALALFQEIRPDVVLSDIHLSGLSGVSLCEQIKADREGRLTPFVLITGLANTQDRVRGFEAGADEYLTKPFEVPEVLARVRSLLRTKRYTDELERAESVLMAMARSVEGRDPSTEGHCERLSLNARLLGQRLGLPDRELTALHRAGLLHDIGKIAVPDAILLKPGKLTEQEWSIMREHPVTGEHICQPIKAFRDVLPIIRHHHERPDGTGYPDGLRMNEIPMTARILKVVDVYDALVTERPYKSALAPSDALEILHHEADRGWSDPFVVDHYTAMVRSGEVA